jgi:3-dehydroquinate synthetase
VACFSAYSLPTTIPAHLTAPQLIAKMMIDKKNKAGQVKSTMLDSIGKVI